MAFADFYIGCFVKKILYCCPWMPELTTVFNRTMLVTLCSVCALSTIRTLTTVFTLRCNIKDLAEAFSVGLLLRWWKVTHILIPVPSYKFKLYLQTFTGSTAHFHSEPCFLPCVFCHRLRNPAPGLSCIQRSSSERFSWCDGLGLSAHGLEISCWWSSIVSCG